MSAPGKLHDNRTPIILECSWCGKKMERMLLIETIVVSISADTETWKRFTLCQPCLDISTSWKGLYLSRIEPGIPFEADNEQEN